MPWTAPVTWTVGQTVTAALLNQQLRDNTNYLYGMDAPVYDSGPIAASVASWTVPATGVLPTNYSVLCAFLQARKNAATATKLQVTFNGDTGANYDVELYEGSGASAAAATVTGQNYIGVHAAGGAEMASSTQAAGAATGYALTIPSYTNATLFKNAELRFFAATGLTIAGAIGGVWKNTAAITSITFAPAAGAFDIGSRLIVVGLGAV